MVSGFTWEEVRKGEGGRGYSEQSEPVIRGETDPAVGHLSAPSHMSPFTADTLLPSVCRSVCSHTLPPAKSLTDHQPITSELNSKTLIGLLLEVN